MCPTSFKGTAISHQDGSELDGIHLIWFPPSEAGYSINGFDIQRRDHNGDHKDPDCYSLTDIDFNTLHSELRFPFSNGRIAVRKSDCPRFPETFPDEPYRPDSKKQCIDFGREERGSTSNPRKSGSVTFSTYERQENKLVLKATSDILEISDFKGLDAGNQLTVNFHEEAVVNLSLSIRLFSKIATIVSYDKDNQPLQKKEIEFKPAAQEISLDDGPVSRLEITSPNNELLLNRLCYQSNSAKHTDPEEREIPVGNSAEFKWPPTSLHNPTVTFARASTGQKGCIVYTIYLNRLHNFVEVAAGFTNFLAIAFSEGKAVATGIHDNPGVIQLATFRYRQVDKVMLYCSTSLRELRICLDRIPDKDEEDRLWGDEKYIARGIQLPLRNFNPALSSYPQELALAKGRLLPSENVEEPSFKDWTELMNTAADAHHVASPVQFYHRSRQQTTEPYMDLHLWPYGLSTMADYRWRRMLGFAFQDKEVNPGNLYDYRISGYFRRADLEESFLGFMTVPEGIRLPLAFRLDSILLIPLLPTWVEYFPEVPEAAEAHTRRKGIRIRNLLRLRLSEPVDEIVIELASDFPQNLSYKAFSSEFLPFGGGVSMVDQVPHEPRVHLSFDSPVNEIHLVGEAFVYGFRLPPVLPMEEAFDVVKKSVILTAVEYKHTPEPTAPPYLGTTQLQQPPIVGDGQTVVDNPRQDLGFQLHWIPPSSATPVPWPDDLDAFPPFDVLAFHLERQRFDTGDPFVNIDDSERPALFMGSRSGRPPHPTLSYGTDLLTAFPLKRTPTPPITHFMEAQDPLFTSETNIGVPGGLYRYRIFSMDILNRLSTTPRLGSIVRLEKHIPPPIPGGVDIVDESRLVPTGVHAYSLQKSDPDISTADLADLGTNDNAIVLEWGWSDEQRSIDPFAREFRVYLESNPPDKIYGTLVGTAVMSGGLFAIQAQMDIPVVANKHDGMYIQAGGYPFKIYSHTGGSFIDILLEPSQLDSTVTPTAGNFLILAEIQGEDIRPAGWEQRTAVIPITAARNYKYVFHNVLNPTASNPLDRKWVGVSAADDQYYIPDERVSGTNGNRPGNESSIAVVPVSARYFGRPVFTVPPPLDDVPELPTQEPVTETVPISLDLPTLFGGSITVPANHKLLIDSLPFASLLQYVSATDTDQIRIDFPDGTNDQYTLGNPGDHSDFLSQLRSGQPAQIEGKFVMDLFYRYQDRETIEKLWERAIADPVSFATIHHVLPADPSRYLFRARLVDQAGHLSENFTLLPVVPRVRSLRAPSRPVLEVTSGSDDTCGVSCSVLDHFDLEHLVLFTYASDITDELNANVLEKAQFLRLPNRTDLYPADGIRLRLQDGTVLNPAASVAASAGVVDGQMRKMETTLTPGYDKKVAVWGVVITRDGIPSLAGGPILGYTGPEPLVVPTLSISNSGQTDQLSWGSLLVPAQVSIERSYDAGITWQQITPWLRPGSLSHEVRTRNQARQYRIKLKDQRGQEAEGSAVTITS